jgi:hypothetical protein
MCAHAEAAAKATLSWSEICERYPNQWVCVLDLVRDLDGAIRSARLIAHDRSINRVLDQIGTSYPSSTVVHTWGRPLHLPRIETTNEIRELIRARR